MKIEKTKNAKRNIMVGLFNKLIVLFLPFLVRTAFIYSLGAEYLGLNSLFTAILNVLNMTELGFSSAVVFSMYEPIATDDTSTICALLNFYRKVYRIIGIVILVAGAVLIPFLPYLIKGECPAELNIYIIYIIYLSNTVVSYLLFAYKKSILEAFQRNDILFWIDTFTVGLTNLFQLILLFIWHDVRAYYLYVVTLLIFTVVNNFLNAVVVNRKYPQYKCSGKLSAENRSSIKKQVSGLMINKICQMTRNSFDSIFVSAFLGLTMTTIYNNYYYVLNAVVGFSTIFTNAITAGVGNSIVTEHKDKNYKDFYTFNFMYMWISGWAAITMFCLYQNFMMLWVGKELTLSVAISFLFSFYFYVLKIGDIRATYSSSAGLWWENRYRAIIEVIENIVLNYFFVKLWGIHGIIIATIIPILTINNTVGMWILNSRYFKKQHGTIEFFSRNSIYFVVTLFASMITWAVCYLTPSNILGLFMKGLICIFVPNLLYFIIYQKNKDYQNAKKWLLARIK